MDNKDVIDNFDITKTIKLETINSDQLVTVEIKKEELPAVDQENNESITEPEPEQIYTDKVKEAEKLETVSEKTLRDIEKFEDTTIVVSDPIQQDSVVDQPTTELDQLLSTSDLESAVPRPPILEMKSKLIKSGHQINIENLENSLYKVEEADQKEKKNSENDIIDALSTLATAALNQTPLSYGTAKSVISKSVQPIVQINHEEPAWCDVGVIKDTTCLVKQFYSTSTTNEHGNTSLNHLPDYSNKLKINIQPGTTYKFRIAAINSCGRGEWSEISSFKTCLPGYPGAPSAIKIKKVPDGARLTWEVPPNTSGKILEYTVILAVKNRKNVPYQGPKPTSTNFNFFRVYCGSHNAAVVSNESLGAALIDRTNKPAMIFQIVAKNEKGYGPATQVRWLQDSNVNVSNKNPSMKRKNRVNLLTGVPKRPKM